MVWTLSSFTGSGDGGVAVISRTSPCLDCAGRVIGREDRMLSKSFKKDEVPMEGCWGEEGIGVEGAVVVSASLCGAVNLDTL